jgi:type IV secretory pathway VirB9-like protein
MRRLDGSVARSALVGACLLAATTSAALAQHKKPPPPPPPAAKDVINAVTADAAVEEQAAGNYPPMARGESLPLGQIQRAWDNAPENAGVQVFRYAPDKVMRLRAREYMTTTIILPSWETVEKAELADDFVFEAGQPRPNIVDLRPKHVGGDSTLTLFGESGNVYAFYVRAEGYNSVNISDVIVHVRAEMPLEMMARMAAVQRTDALGGETRGLPGGVEKAAIRSARDRAITGEKDPDFLKPINFDPTKLRYDFSMTGDKSIAPERVSTDGHFTWFDYGARWDTSDLPAVYRVVDGIDTPINTRIMGTALVAEVSGAFTLRNGQRVVCVRPEGWIPEGEYRPPTMPSNRPGEAAGAPRESTAANYPTGNEAS